MRAKGFLRLSPSEQIDELWDELAREKVFEVNLRSKDFVVDGLMSGGTIYIDPRPAIIETLLHELLHRRKPRLKERSVEQAAKILISTMDESTKQKWWREYKKRARKARPVDVID